MSPLRDDQPPYVPLREMGVDQDAQPAEPLSPPMAHRDPAARALAWLALAEEQHWAENYAAATSAAAIARARLAAAERETHDRWRAEDVGVMTGQDAEKVFREAYDLAEGIEADHQRRT